MRRAPLAGFRARAVAAAEPNRSLLANAGSMLGASLVTSILGAVFWFVAAHDFSREAVGVGSAAVSAMTLLGFMASFGLGTLLMGELPRREAGHRSLLNAALVVSGLGGCALGLAFALLAPLVSSNLDDLQGSLVAISLFAAGAGLTALGLVLDQALIGLLRGTLQLLRNFAFAAIKLLALVAIALLIADAGATWIYSAWTVGIALSLLVLVRFYKRREGDRLRPDFASLRGMRGSAASHASVNLGLETADLAMPVIVVMLLSPAENASFYIAWMIVGFLTMVPFSLSTVAYAIGSGDTEASAARLRFTLSLSLLFALLACLVLLPAASPLLGVFGESYSDAATVPLQIMALGVFPLTVKTHYVAIRRVERRLGRALPLVWAGTMLELGGGALGAALGGLSGVAWGWLAGLAVEAVAMSGPVLRTVGRGGGRGGPAPRELSETAR